MFGGETFSEKSDGSRLRAQLAKVKAIVADGAWYSLADLSLLAEAPEASVSARLRDLRKLKFGGHTINRRRISGGLHEYRMAGIAPA